MTEVTEHGFTRHLPRLANKRDALIARGLSCYGKPQITRAKYLPVWMVIVPTFHPNAPWGWNRIVFESHSWQKCLEFANDFAILHNAKGDLVR